MSVDGVRSLTLVTGASSGIGEAVALGLAEDHELILHGRDAARLRRVRESCPRPGVHLEWLCDLTQVDLIGESLGDRLQGGVAGVASLVHCAGTTRVAALRATPLHEIERIFAVNVLALLEIVRVLGERQCEGRKLKSIVVVSSAASVRGEKGVAAYAASKGAVNGAVRTLAAELAPEVRVNAVLPGLVRTPMTDHTVKEDGEFDRLARRYPLGLGSAEQVGAVVRELLSPGSRWVTGGCWAVDGGLTAS